MTVVIRIMSPSQLPFEADHIDSRIAMDCADRNRVTSQLGD